MAKTSEQINEIAAALAKAQGAIEGAVKGKVNPAFRSKYADLGSVWDACREHLSKNGIAVVQPIALVDARSVIVTRLLHTSGQFIEDDGVPLMLGKQDMQGLGSAITYARRYGLMAMVGIAPEDDDGNAAVEKKPATVVVEAPSTPSNLPAGSVLLQRVEQAQTSKGKPYWTVTDSNGEVYKEWDQRRASAMEQYAQNRVPVVLETKATKWGTDITGLRKADADIQIEREPFNANEPPLTDDDLSIPF